MFLYGENLVEGPCNVSNVTLICIYSLYSHITLIDAMHNCQMVMLSNQNLTFFNFDILLLYMVGTNDFFSRDLN